jgi:uncharacterized membrane protein YbhN (UPF0104 family)
VAKIKPIIKILFIFVAFYIIYHKIDFQKLKSLEIKNYIYLILAFFAFNLSQIISAIRLNEYLKSIGLKISPKIQTKLYYIGMFYNTLLPGGIGGDGYKAYLFNKNYKIPYKKIIKAMLIDRLSGLFAILAILGVIVDKMIFVLVLALILLFLIHKFIFKEFRIAPFFLSIAIQLLQGLAFILIILSLGVESNLFSYLALFYISSIISVIPISVGGVGLRELTFLYGVKFFNIDATIGIVGAFIFFLINLISSAIGIFFLKGAKDV